MRHDAVTPGGGPAGSDPAYALEQWLDPFGISAAVLIPLQAGTVIPWGDEAAGTEFLHAINQHLLEHWVQLDLRYRLALSVSPYDMSGALAEIERLGDASGVCAVFLPVATNGLGRTQYFPIYEAAESLGLPLVLHTAGAEGNLMDAHRVAGGLPSTFPERHSLVLQPGQAMLASAIFGGVFERFPKLRLVLTEYGVSWLPSLMWRMDAAWERGHGQSLPKPPSAYVSANVRFTTQPLDEPPDLRMLGDLLEMCDAQRTLMFSSDYPHWDTDSPRVILSQRLPQHLRAPVAYETALECFGDRLGLAL